MIKGVPVSPGTGLGTAFVHKEANLDWSSRTFSGADGEKKRLKDAMEIFARDSEALAEDLKVRVGQKEAEIVSGHALLLEDPYLNELMNAAIDGGEVAEAAVTKATDEVARLFLSMDSEMMRARSQDMRAIRDRMLKILLGAETANPSDIPPGTVFAADELTPYMATGFKRENIEAILTKAGGKTSHSAILARAMGIPAVMGVGDALDSVKDGDFVAVDGDAGTAVVNPPEETKELFEAKKREWLAHKAALKVFRDRKTTDGDGNLYRVMANVSGLKEVEMAAENGAEGVGLLRTEMLFMDRGSLPSEEEQLATYRKAAEIMGERELIVRTMDIGGDKEVPYLDLPKEPNPFLGYRAIRFCLDEPAIFGIQIRAILRAGLDRDNVKIMLPLVTGLDELLAAKELMEKEKAALREKGVPHNPDIPVGIMIETPASVILAPVLAKHAAFFSLGTNDLTQYTLAADRLNPKLDKLYSHFHPAVLKSVETAVKAAKEAGIRAGMCGESAGTPALIPLYMSFGLDELSVNPASVPGVRREISLWSRSEADAITREAMRLQTTERVRECLEGYLKERDAKK
ncbi:MAG: phosphoenolpyruvate--protein phosphotransferase [Deltaproteobacteria bacterium]|jgi:phosphotransferase system enzyme I (PtsI)|nr:phosphoenolpyruvate--protein phosphotransferase [Deltaproteobacteria bacterium]